MTPAQASSAWQKRQAALLRKTYRQGWQKGAKTAPKPPPGVTVPTTPNAAAMARALGPALLSLAKMGAAIALIVPTAAMIAAAGSVIAAQQLAILAWLKSNGWLLAAGISVAWAGEQAGYAQRANAGGLLLQWELDPSPLVHHCADCPQLAALPAVPLNLWPTLPGEGMTECNVGCRCSMRAVEGPVPALSAEQHEILARVGARQPVLAA